MPILNDWLESLGSERTRYTYRKAWADWWGWAQPHYLADWKTLTTERAFLLEAHPALLIAHRFEEIKKDPPARFHCEDLVTEWDTSLKTRGFADGSRRMYVAVVASFFKYGTRGVGKLGLTNIHIGKKRRRVKFKPTQLEVLKLRRFCDPREWALVACVKDSGFGPDQLSHILSSQITMLEPDWWCITGQREKTGEDFVTFWGPDATNAYRSAYGTPNDPTKPAFPLTGNAIRMTMWRAINRASLPKGMSPYALRAFFNTQLETAKVPDNWRKRAMGHSLGQVQGAYSGPQLSEWLKTYKEAYRFLSVENGGVKPDTLNGTEAVELLMAVQSGDRETVNKFLERFPQLSKYVTGKIGAEQ